AHVEANKPLVAECGGMMACFDTLCTMDGTRHLGFGLLPGTTTMQRKLAGLGLLAVDLQECLSEGRLTGHTFHYSTVETTLEPIAQAIKTTTGQPSEAIYRDRFLTASYMHFYFPSNPETTAGLFLGHRLKVHGGQLDH
ncbi:MAG: hypothetical protein Q8O31_05785, partial [Rhodocyclaceae bacterium]|nr:hypothetical protein [Rhodocyclaceae bacterium]